MNDILKEKIASLPSKSGVYLFKDSSGSILYIGKAVVLKNRVRSYFQEGRFPSPRTEVMVLKIEDMECIVTDSEVEALILEANLIKEHRPRYNVNLKDDKSFPYIRVTNEPFPRVFVTRKIIHDGSKYFGPYTQVGVVRETVKTLERIFTIRSCKYWIDDEVVKAKKIKVCLDYHIKKCQGPCEGLVSQSEYNRMITQVQKFLNGKNSELLKEFRVNMETRAENLEFEEAARIRNQIKLIENYTNNQKVVENKLVDRDVFAYALEDTDACGVIFKIRDGKVLGRQHYYLNQVDPNQPGEILKNIIQQYYLSSDFIPEEIFLPEEIEDTELITKWLGERKQEKVSVLVPEKGEKRKLVKMCQKNAQLLLAELKLQKLKYQEHIPYPIQALEKDLHLPKPPRRIEGFDISHIQGTDTVASLVLFEDGKPKKSEYRHYKIETVQGVDDFLSMKEVVERRYRRLVSEGKPLPDLIVIDGGKGQLSSAVEVLQKLGIADQPVVGLAKRLEEVFLPGHSDPQNIPKTSSGLRLLQHIRDESHRFAITFHRSLRGKRMVLSELDEIQGIGAGKRKKLLEHFGSVAKLKDASANEIGSVKGITKTDVKKITRHFHPDEVVD